MKFLFRQLNDIREPLMSIFFSDSTKNKCQKRNIHNRKRFRQGIEQLKNELLFLILKKA